MREEPVATVDNAIRLAMPAQARSICPPVTILITARNRPEELAKTLQTLRDQTYSNLEMVVIDDASDIPLQEVVRRAWPAATVLRNESPIGLVEGRSVGMATAEGTYILILDDDSCLTRPDDIDRAVARLEAEPEIAVLSFLIYERPALPPSLPTGGTERYVHTFSGGAQMMRKRAAKEVGGYRDFYFYGGEEAEYSLRLLDHGWRILKFPSVVVHHRKSPIGRSLGRIWAYSFRNSVWTVLLLYPFPRVIGMLVWRVFVNVLEMIRRGELRWGLWVAKSLVRDLPSVIRRRKPISLQTIRTVESLSVRTITKYEAAMLAQRVGLRERWQWFRTVWWRRRRERAFWDRRTSQVDGPNPGARGIGPDVR